MASTRRPTALGPAPAPGESVPHVGKRGRASPIVDEEERTTVDDIPPQKPTAKRGSKWEESTFQDRGNAQPKRLRDPPRIDPEDADSIAGTIDRGIDAETIEETTVAEGGKAQGLANGSNEVGLSTIDEPTREEGRRPLPPLAVLGSSDEDEDEDEDDEDAAPTRVAINAKLVMIGGNDRGREFQISASKSTIGRGVDNDVVLTDIAVSRRHVTVEFDGKGFLVRDLQSGNGTLVNNERKSFARLNTGDQLEIGNTLIRFECPQAAAQPSAAARPTLAEDDDDDEDALTIAGRAPPRPTPRPNMPLPAVRGTTGPLPSMPPPVRSGDPMPTMPISRVAMANANGVLLAPSSADKRKKILIGAAAGLGVILLVVIAAAMSGGDNAATTTGFAAGNEREAGEVPATATGNDPKKAPAPTVAPTDEKTGPDSVPSPPDAKIVKPQAGNPPEANIVTPAPTGADRAGAIAAAAKKKRAAKKKPVAKKKRAAKKKPVAKKKRAAKRKPVAKKKRAAKKKKKPRVATATRAKSRVSATKITAARNKAKRQYKAKKFSSAASTLRSVAARAGDDDAERLESLAAEYAAVGDNLSRGAKNKSANPPAALSAYRKALSVDRRAGSATHASYIRMKLGEVSPKAAASFMAQRRYEAAKRACDAAVNYGAGSDPMVGRVRKALDKKAGEFYKNALKLRKNKPKQAKSLLKRVLKIVPPDSRWYAKSYKLLNSAKKKPRDDDE